jgi:hypothetical protein
MAVLKAQGARLVKVNKRKATLNAYIENNYCINFVILIYYNF